MRYANPLFFFFSGRSRHTRWPRDWSSDVCSSELPSPGADVPLALWRRWGLATLGALAALPAADLFERLGAAGLAWHAMARGLDTRPLMPTAEPQPFEATCAFDWPIE